jgi:TorA maturation chaperone TorD
VELEFMAFLCSLEAQAWEREASKEGIEILEWQQDFLGQHLGRWFSAFVRQLAAVASESFYAVAAIASGAFIHHDRDLVTLLLEGAPAATTVS